MLGIYGALDNQLPPHGSSIYDLNQIHEILLGLETANKLGMIWGAIIHFHVLSVEKENSGGDVTDVKVSCVDRSFIGINNVDGSHVT